MRGMDHFDHFHPYRRRRRQPVRLCLGNQRWGGADHASHRKPSKGDDQRP